MGSYQYEQSPPVVEDIEGLVGGSLLELCSEENHVASEMNWIDVFETEASCICI